MTARLDVEINPKGAVVGGKRAENALDRVGRSARKSDTSVGLFNKSLLITAGVTAFVAGMAKATQASILFQDSLAEVSTLLNDVPGEMEAISKAAKEQAIQFGSQPVEQTKAFYQIISAGASNAAEATETLTAANKLAVGGVTSVTIAADGLTSVMNVYGKEVITATEASDTMFVGMKAGKTTIGELSAGIGKVIPVAQKIGVSFEEVVSAIATLTKGGISTTESITGLRAVLAAIVGPSEEAKKVAKDLGIEFNAAGLEGKTLAEFLKEVEKETGGNTETLKKLFGGIEALVPVLALSGKGAVTFAAVLEQMQTKAGATEEAFGKMAKSPGFQIKRLLAATTVVLITLGDKISSVLAPAIELLVDNLDVFTNAWDFAADEIGTAIDFWVFKFDQVTEAFSDIDLDVNKILPDFDLVTEGIGGVIVDILKLVKSGLNVLIGGFVGAFDFITGKWGSMPDVLSSIVIKSVNFMIATLELGINGLVNGANIALEGLSKGAVKTVNLLITAFNGVPFLDDQKLLRVPQFNTKEFSVSLGRIEDQAEGSATKMALKMKEAFNNALGIDFIGQTLDFITESPIVPDEFVTMLEEAGSSIDAFSEKLSNLGGGGEGGEIGMTFQEGFRGRLNEMVESSRTAAAQIGEAFANVFGPGGSLARGFANSVGNAIVFGTSVADSMRRIGAQIVSQLISKLIQASIQMAFTGAAAETMSATTSAAIIGGQTASTVHTVASQEIVAANMVKTNTVIATSAAPAAALETVATAGGSAVLGAAAFTAALVAMLAFASGTIKFAKGGTFTNSVVDSPTNFSFGQMGEAGPEAIMPLNRDSSGRLGVVASLPNGQGGSTVFAPVINVEVNNPQGDGQDVGNKVSRQIKQQMEVMFSTFIQKQQRPGGQLNRPRFG